MSYRILLVEDEENINRGITLKLKKEGYQVDSAFSLEEARAFMKKEEPGLVICDIGLPDGSGLDFCREVRKRSEVLFLFLTALDTEPDIVAGYEMGADDYVTKPFSLMVLLSKVKVMLQRRGDKREENVYVSGDIRLDERTCSVTVKGEQVSFTPNEYKMLVLFLENPRQILTKGQLLEAIWDGDSEYVDENTIAVNIRRLREKIEENPSRPEYIRNIRGMGYIWDVAGERGN